MGEPAAVCHPGKQTPSAKELAWVRECLNAGDSFEEIAAWSGREPDEIRSWFGKRHDLSPKLRDTLSLYVAGVKMEAIGREVYPHTACPRKSASAAVQHLRRRGFDLPYREAGRPRNEALHG